MGETDNDLRRNHAKNVHTYHQFRIQATLVLHQLCSLNLAPVRFFMPRKVDVYGNLGLRLFRGVREKAGHDLSHQSMRWRWTRACLVVFPRSRLAPRSLSTLFDSSTTCRLPFTRRVGSLTVEAHSSSAHSTWTFLVSWIDETW